MINGGGAAEMTLVEDHVGDEAPIRVAVSPHLEDAGRRLPRRGGDGAHLRGGEAGDRLDRGDVADGAASAIHSA